MIRAALTSLFGGANPKLPENWHGRVPPGAIAYAIGDVHGYDDALANIYDQIDEHRARYPGLKAVEFLLSDMTDRGPHTREVFDLQVKRHDQNRKAGVITRYVLADHEYMFKSMLSDKAELTSLSKAFFDNGGLETLRSFGVTPRISATEKDASAHQIYGTDMFVHDAEMIKMKLELRAKISREHLWLLNEAVPMLHLGSYTFVHAAVDPTKPIKTEAQDIALVTGMSNQSRDFPKYTGPIPGNRVIVRGHSISEKPVLTHNQIGIDTGIFRPDGKLTCAILHGSEVSFFQAGTSLPPYSLNATVKRATAASNQAGPISAWAALE